MDARYEVTADRFNEFARRLLHKPGRIILDVDARDCRDMLMIHARHPEAMSFAFECKPEILPMCRKAVAGRANVMLIEEAAMYRDGTTRFFKFAAKHTTRSWEDGNPGASSLLRAPVKYPSEEYPQIQIGVPAIRLRPWGDDVRD
jgi:hypothetical protein